MDNFIHPASVAS